MMDPLQNVNNAIILAKNASDLRQANVKHANLLIKDHQILRNAFAMIIIMIMEPVLSANHVTTLANNVTDLHLRIVQSVLQKLIECITIPTTSVFAKMDFMIMDQIPNVSHAITLVILVLTETKLPIVLLVYLVTTGSYMITHIVIAW